MIKRTAERFTPDKPNYPRLVLKSGRVLRFRLHSVDLSLSLMLHLSSLGETMIASSEVVGATLGAHWHHPFYDLDLPKRAGVDWRTDLLEFGSYALEDMTGGCDGFPGLTTDEVAEAFTGLYPLVLALYVDEKEREKAALFSEAASTTSKPTTSGRKQRAGRNTSTRSKA